ncbi:MAG TPA: copper amine oxidase N-terminal domain-containing protein, partial [Caldisericia bacterium]|nr:copper amine oxidase N-terminal domain-containing protein [Caldisericia bacterium]
MTIGSKKAFVNGLEWPVDITPPFIVSKTGRTMVPFRFIGEHLGATVDWFPKDKAVETVTYKLNDVYIELFIGKKTAKKNGQQIELDQEPMIVNGSTMVPVRFVTEQFGS